MSHLECALENEKKHQQDRVNNNHLACLEEKTKSLILNDDQFLFPESGYLFDPSLLAQGLEPAKFLFKYDKFDVQSEKHNHIDLGDGLILRPLRRDDYQRDYIPLLSQLTDVGDISQKDYERRFDKMRSSMDTYYICVVEDLSKQKIVASLTLVYEQKFIRQTSARARVEDMVVDANYRGKKLSKLLLDVICQLGKHLGCYKISLECKDHLRGLYEQFGFALEPCQNYLCRRY
jgi:glucosamine-phosphate N-acetyltransferase